MANKMNRQRPWKRRLRLGFHGASFTTFDRSCGLELWDKIFSAQMGLVPSGAANNLSYCLYGTRQNSVCRHPTHFSTGGHSGQLGGAEIGSSRRGVGCDKDPRHDRVPFQKVTDVHVSSLPNALNHRRGYASCGFVC